MEIYIIAILSIISFLSLIYILILKKLIRNRNENIDILKGMVESQNERKTIINSKH